MCLQTLVQAIYLVPHCIDIFEDAVGDLSAPEVPSAAVSRTSDSLD